MLNQHSSFFYNYSGAYASSDVMLKWVPIVIKGCHPERSEGSIRFFTSLRMTIQDDIVRCVRTTIPGRLVYQQVITIKT